MTNATAAPADTRTTREAIRDELQHLVGIVDGLHQNEMEERLGTAVAILGFKARGELANRPGQEDDPEIRAAVALAASIAVMAQLSTEWGFRKTCALEGPETYEAFTYMKELARMARVRWIEGE
jgi:hypothetical protein